MLLVALLNAGSAHQAICIFTITVAGVDLVAVARQQRGSRPALNSAVVQGGCKIHPHLSSHFGRLNFLFVFLEKERERGIVDCVVLSMVMTRQVIRCESGVSTGHQ